MTESIVGYVTSPRSGKQKVSGTARTRTQGRIWGTLVKSIFSTFRLTIWFSKAMSTALLILQPKSKCVYKFSWRFIMQFNILTGKIEIKKMTLDRSDFNFDKKTSRIMKEICLTT